MHCAAAAPAACFQNAASHKLGQLQAFWAHWTDSAGSCQAVGVQLRVRTPARCHDVGGAVGWAPMA